MSIDVDGIAGLDSPAGKPGGGSAAREQSGAGSACAGLWTGWTFAAAMPTGRSKARESSDEVDELVRALGRSVGRGKCGRISD